MMTRDVGGDMHPRQQQEERHMSQKEIRPGGARRMARGRLVGAGLATGGLSAALVAVGTPAGAANRVVVSTSKNATYGTILVSGKTGDTLKSSNTSAGTNCRKVW